MLSKSCTNNLKTCLGYVRFWGCCPYEWDEETKRVRILSSSFRKYAYWLNIAVIVMYEAFVVIQCINVTFFKDNQTSALKIYMQYASVTYMLPVVFHINFFLRNQEFPKFVNSFLDYFEELQGKYKIQEVTKYNEARKNGCEKFQKLFMCLGHLICCINLIIAFRSPERPVLLSALLKNPRRLKWWQLLPTAGFHCYHWFSLWANMYLFVIPMYAYVWNSLIVMDKLRYRCFHLIFKGKGKNEFRTLYQMSQNLHSFFNYTYGIGIVGQKALMVLMGIRSIYASVRMTGGIRILMFVVAFVTVLYLSVTFKKLAEFHTLSAEAVKSWEHSDMKRKGEFPKFLFSCRPLKVSVGSMYFVDRGMVFTLISIIVESALNLLLTG